MCINVTHDIIYVSSCISNIIFKHCSIYFLQIDVLYQGQPVIQSGLCLSISYFNCWFFSIIHQIPTWCNILFNTYSVIISLQLEFIFFIDKLACFLRLLHLVATVYTIVCQHFIYDAKNAAETLKTCSTVTVTI